MKENNLKTSELRTPKFTNSINIFLTPTFSLLSKPKAMGIHQYI